MAESLVRETLHHGALVEAYGRADVITEPDRESLARIFHMHRLKYLRIEVVPPNPLSTLQRRLFARMDSLKADKLIEELQSDKPEGLQLDDSTKGLAQVAASHGVVTGRGDPGQGRIQEVSTKDHPLAQKITFDPNTTTARDALAQAAGGVTAQLTSREGNDQS